MKIYIEKVRLRINNCVPEAGKYLKIAEELCEELTRLPDEKTGFYYDIIELCLMDAKIAVILAGLWGYNIDEIDRLKDAEKSIEDLIEIGRAQK